MWVTCVYGCIQAETLLLRFRTFSGSWCPLPCHLMIWWSPPLLTLAWESWRLLVAIQSHNRRELSRRSLGNLELSTSAISWDMLGPIALGCPRSPCGKGKSTFGSFSSLWWYPWHSKLQHSRRKISTQRCVSIVSNKYIFRDLRWCHVCVTACTHI